MRPKSKVLIIAGSDSSGGAGIQADLKTITTIGSYGMTAITVVTSQNTLGVKSIVPISPKEISNQIEYSVKDIKPDAIKIGMLFSEKIVNSVASSLKKIKVSKVVLDPVMVSTSGHRLISPKCINAIKYKLFNKIDLLTPNIPEAEILTKMKIDDLDDMIKASKKLISIGCKNVLLKGGHLKSKMIFDIFTSKSKMVIFKNKKINSKNTHGTGCTLSSAIATYYSHGKSLKKSCHLAIKYVNQSINSSPNYGKGNGPINHLNNIKKILL